MQHITLVFLFFCVACTSYARESNVKEAFTLGNQVIQPATKQSWMQGIAGTQIPITVMHGQHPGPVLLLTAGVHGDEFPAIFALQKLAQDINVEQLRGTLMIVHLANIEGFHARRIALNPVDEKNLNRVFPGRVDGTLTEQIAYFLTHNMISKTDYLIDIHSGSWNQSLLPHVYSPVVQNQALDEKTLAFAKALGIPHIVLYDERPRDPNNSISLPNTAQTRGKPGLTLEVGQLGQRGEQEIAMIYASCFNALHFLDMLPSPDVPHQSKLSAVLYRKIVDVDSPVTGIFYPTVKVGMQVTKGQKVGWISDYFGRHLIDLLAPATGTVLMQKETPPIRKGEASTDIGIIQ